MQSNQLTPEELGQLTPDQKIALAREKQKEKFNNQKKTDLDEFFQDKLIKTFKRILTSSDIKGKIYKASDAKFYQAFFSDTELFNDIKKYIIDNIEGLDLDVTPLQEAFNLLQELGEGSHHIQLIEDLDQYIFKNVVTPICLFHQNHIQQSKETNVLDELSILVATQEQSLSLVQQNTIVDTFSEEDENDEIKRIANKIIEEFQNYPNFVARKGETVLYQAMFNAEKYQKDKTKKVNNLKLVTMILDDISGKKNFDVNQPCNFPSSSRSNGTALIYASQHGDLEIVKLLVKRGANIEKTCIDYVAGKIIEQNAIDVAKAEIDVVKAKISDAKTDEEIGKLENQIRCLTETVEFLEIQRLLKLPGVKEWILTTGPKLIANGSLLSELYLKITGYLLELDRYKENNWQPVTFINDLWNSIKAPKGCPYSGISQGIGWATQQILMQLDPNFNFENCPMPTIQLSPAGFELYFRNEGQANCLMPYLDYHSLSPEKIPANGKTIGKFGPFPTKIIMKEFKNTQSYIENLCQFDHSYTRGLYLTNNCGILYFHPSETIIKKLLDYTKDEQNQDLYKVIKKLCEEGRRQEILCKEGMRQEYLKKATLIKITQTLDLTVTDLSSFSRKEIELLNVIARELKLNDLEKKCINFIVIERNAPKIIKCLSKILNKNRNFLQENDKNKIIDILENNTSPGKALSLIKEKILLHKFSAEKSGLFSKSGVKTEDSLTQAFYSALRESITKGDVTDLNAFYENNILQHNNRGEFSFSMKNQMT